MNNKPKRLGVNIDHIATIRQLRRGRNPDPVYAAAIVEQAGADGVVAHLREDRRHINDNDLALLKKSVTTQLNLEMSINPEIVAIAAKTKPHQATLVPEKRRELTTEGGLNVHGLKPRIKKAVSRLKDKGIKVSLFIEPSFDQVEESKTIGADSIELHTGKYALAKGVDRENELGQIIKAARYAKKIGLSVFAGHGLDYRNVKPIAGIEEIEELNIGYSIICRAVFVGLETAVKEMLRLIKSA
ncbi:MAG: pyridoxine 5'-phosphate synthase [Candidatus Omnitrophica bacterium CG11_big_fil_rev_8_21_14_0_20_42_13]|uniref:Pyridoxine 5'-phosphate synthase n=1 Tax=Candidatus Ghiorseimicrobium undicola TaxID=1974746 RepID=A0A2H0M040_9BACT|nr:MAG: pyridoxine 5'-phosphate synthase [Candidatus Omnitrophica bacterium CG11_big_fil_rev_8_21_14_0_20_42_13]